MKTCSRCEIEQEDDQFTIVKRGNPWCKACRKEYDAARYKKIGPKKWTRTRGSSREKRRKWFVEYKSTLKCEKCEENHPACLDFHHVDPLTKSHNISVIVSLGRSRKLILEELKKCIVLCSNCHRKHHWNGAG